MNGFCQACSLPWEKKPGSQRQKRLYSSSWWCLDSCRCPVSGQRGHGGATSTAGGHTAYGVLLRPSGNEFTTGWGGFGSTWLRGGPSGPWRTSKVAPTRCWSGPTRLGRSRWARRWRSSAGTASSHTWAVWILWQHGRQHLGGRGRPL